jgi:YD repeat-containing protein
MKKLLLTASYLAAAICIAVMTPQSASAQCNYRMNDIGRPHGYLSGPCNGAAQNYSGAYPSRQRSSPAGVTRGVLRDRNGKYMGTNVTHSDGSVSGNGMRTVRTGPNTASTYDNNGRLIGYGVRQGNVLRSYNSQGRFIASVVMTGSRHTVYNSRGRHIATSNLR